MKERIEFIDFAKGFAIFYIMVYHFLQPFHFNSIVTGLIAFGGSGVHLFFFLSGYGLSLSVFKGIKLFFKRRFINIVLPFYIYILVAFLFSRFTPVFSQFGWDAFFANIFLYKMFSATYITSFGFQLWFFSTIVQFYLVYPLLVWTLNKTGKRNFILLSFILSIGWMTLIYFLGQSDNRAWNSCFLRYLWEFGLGMVAVGIDRNRYKISLQRMILIFVLSFIVMFISIKYLGTFGRLYNDFIALIAFSSFTFLLYTLGLQKILAFIRLSMVWINHFSYELYLVHILVLLSLWELLKLAGISYSLWLVPGFIIIAIGIAWLFSKLVTLVKSYLK